MKNQGNILPYNNNNTIAYKFKGMEFWDLADNEFRVAVSRNSVSYKKTQRKFSEIRTTIYE